MYCKCIYAKRREDELNKLVFEASEEESIIFEIVEENYSDDDMMFIAIERGRVIKHIIIQVANENRNMSKGLFE